MRESRCGLAVGLGSLIASSCDSLCAGSCLLQEMKTVTVILGPALDATFFVG